MPSPLTVSYPNGRRRRLLLPRASRDARRSGGSDPSRRAGKNPGRLGRRVPEAGLKPRRDGANLGRQPRPGMAHAGESRRHTRRRPISGPDHSAAGREGDRAANLDLVVGAVDVSSAELGDLAAPEVARVDDDQCGAEQRWHVVGHDLGLGRHGRLNGMHDCRDAGTTDAERGGRDQLVVDGAGHDRPQEGVRLGSEPRGLLSQARVPGPHVGGRRSGQRASWQNPASGRRREPGGSPSGPGAHSGSSFVVRRSSASRSHREAPSAQLRASPPRLAPPGSSSARRRPSPGRSASSRCTARRPPGPCSRR